MATEDQIIKLLADLKLPDTPANREIVLSLLNQPATTQDGSTSTTVPSATLPSASDLLTQITLEAQAQTQTTGNKSGANYLLGYAYPQRIVKGNVSGVQIPSTDIETFRGDGGMLQKYTGDLLVDKNGNISQKQ